MNDNSKYLLFHVKMGRLRGQIKDTPFSLQLTNGPNKIALSYIRLERLTRDKHSSLMGPFVGYKES